MSLKQSRKSEGKPVALECSCVRWREIKTSMTWWIVSKTTVCILKTKSMSWMFGKLWEKQWQHSSGCCGNKAWRVENRGFLKPKFILNEKNIRVPSSNFVYWFFSLPPISPPCVWITMRRKKAGEKGETWMDWENLNWNF